MKCLNCVQYCRCGCRRNAWRERCCAILPHCVMLLQNKPGVSVALDSPLTHCFWHSGYPHIPRSPSMVMLAKFCFVTVPCSLFLLDFSLDTCHSIFSYCNFTACFLSLLPVLLHLFVLFFYPNLCWQLLLFSSYFNDVPLIVHRISSQCDKFWFWQSVILSRNLL